MTKKLNLINKLTFSLLIIGMTELPVQAVDCFPENNLSFPISQNKNITGPQKYQIDEVIETFKSKMQPIVTKRLNKELKIELDWENPKVNASATRDDDNNPIISLYGGMTRHTELTKDGLLGILCHEIGHHLGGAPKKKRGNSNKRSWSSAEGQADYFAGTKCLPLFFNNPLETINLDVLSNKKEVDFAESHCGNNPICTRTALTGLSMARVFASLKNYHQMPSIELNDHTEVWETTYSHPKPQCRLDTVLSGALCSVPPSQPFDPLDPNIGSCYRNGDEALEVAGERPRCWFSPSNN